MARQVPLAERPPIAALRADQARQAASAAGTARHFGRDHGIECDDAHAEGLPKPRHFAADAALGPVLWSRDIDTAPATGHFFVQVDTTCCLRPFGVR